MNFIKYSYTSNIKFYKNLLNKQKIVQLKIINFIIIMLRMNNNRTILIHFSLKNNNF